LVPFFPRHIRSAITGLKEAKDLAGGSILCPIQICDIFAPPAPIGKYWLSCLWFVVLPPTEAKIEKFAPCQENALLSEGFSEVLLSRAARTTGAKIKRIRLKSIDSELKTGNCCSLTPGWDWEGCDFRLPLKS
jgi:hypothetical protein